MKTRKHILITGTGRSGTSFLVELCTNLGLDTGFDSKDLENKNKSLGRAGLEKDIRNKNCPYIVKNPCFCDYADEVFTREDIFIEHIFVPIRNLNAAAQSRIHVHKSGIEQQTIWTKVMIKLGLKKIGFDGGIWHTRSVNTDNQSYILLNQLYKLMLSISNSTTELTLIRYPLLTKNPKYLYEKLNPILKNISYQTFLDVFNRTVNPEFVNQFNSDDC